MLNHLKTFLATFGPVMLVFTMVALLRFGLVLEMVR